MHEHKQYWAIVPELGGCQTYVLRNRKKGGFSKGGFCRVQCHGQGNKNTQGYWPQHYIWHSERHIQARRTFCKSPPSKNPLFLVPDVYVFLGVIPYGLTCAHSARPVHLSCIRMSSHHAQLTPLNQ